MQNRWTSLLSAFGIPVLGLIGLTFGLWHFPVAAKPSAADTSLMMLLDPDPRQDKSLAICLRAEAKDVARCQTQLGQTERWSARSYAARSAEICRRRDGLNQAVADYNLIARECTPAVFQTTHLPSSLALSASL